MPTPAQSTRRINSFAATKLRVEKRLEDAGILAPAYVRAGRNYRSYVVGGLAAVGALACTYLAYTAVTGATVL